VKAQLQQLRQHLLTGVSYVIPLIACGGILIALSIAFAPMTPKGPDLASSPILNALSTIGAAAFALMLPVLAAYIAYSMAGKPGLTSGFVGGYLAGSIKAGFLGALVAGLLAGLVVQWLKRIPTHRHIRPIMPILIIPIVSSVVVGVVMLDVIGVPISHLMTSATNMLATMSTGNRILLALVLGAMIAFDMGGPINKTAFFFGAAMIREGDPRVMGACAAAICTPPLGLGLATLLRRPLWTTEEREAGIAGLLMGLMGITEGAIPFAAADPLRVIPCIMAGSMVAAVVAMISEVGDHAPHGGPIVIPVVDHVVAYVIAILAGTIVTALLMTATKHYQRSRGVAGEAAARGHS